MGEGQFNQLIFIELAIGIINETGCEFAIDAAALQGDGLQGEIDITPANCIRHNTRLLANHQNTHFIIISYENHMGQ